MLQYYMHIPDPDKLSDDEWCYKVAVLTEIRKLEKREHDVVQQLINTLTGSKK